MRNVMRSLAILIPLGLAAAGCANTADEPATRTSTMGSAPYINSDFGTLTYRAVDLMLAAAPQIAPDTPLVVASLSDVQNLESGSALGNIAADMIRTRLVQDGHSASEIRLRNAIAINKGQGEFFLSRDTQTLVPFPSIAAVVTGTYAASFDKVYVSLKLVAASDAHIIAGADFVVPSWDVAGLLPQHRT